MDMTDLEQIADSDTVLTYQVFLVKLATDKKLEALNKASLAVSQCRKLRCLVFLVTDDWSLQHALSHFAAIK